LRRNDEVYLDALGAQHIPDPTTAGDFCRRFAAVDGEILQDTLNEVRLGVWQRQPAAFCDQAIVDVDGVLALDAPAACQGLAETYGECKARIGLAYDGTWGYHPLVVSLANTQEPLYLSNRPGHRPSHEGAAEGPGDRTGPVAAVRRGALLLLPHESAGRVARGRSVPSQRSLPPGEFARAAPQRRAGPAHAGGQFGEQLGLHGDGGAGLSAAVLNTTI
jgi:hypothetical protein